MYSQVQKSLRKDDGKGSESLVALHFLEIKNKDKKRKEENVWKKGREKKKKKIGLKEKRDR